MRFLIDIPPAVPEKVRYAAETNEPSQVARFLLELTGEFSTYYRANKVADPVIP